jgi:hypothetical protein
VTGVVAGNISGEATSRLGNIFGEAMRGAKTSGFLAPHFEQRSWLANSVKDVSHRFSRASAFGCISRWWPHLQ